MNIGVVALLAGVLLVHTDVIYTYAPRAPVTYNVPTPTYTTSPPKNDFFSSSSGTSNKNTTIASTSLTTMTTQIQAPLPPPLAAPYIASPTVSTAKIVAPTISQSSGTSASIV